MQYEALSAELERALVRQLALRYAEVNDDRFGKRLRTPLIALASARSYLGRWIAKTRTLELAREFACTRPWLEVTSVLEHEMAHQYVDEVLGVRDESAHGETFRRVCAERGIDARAAGLPATGGEAEDEAATRTLDRIRKLLALAASSNQHEAEIAMRRAHELMLRHNSTIDALGNAEGYVVRHLGVPLRRGNRVETEVMLLLGEFFFVKVIRVPVYVAHAGKTGNVYEIAGTRPNVEMAEHVHAFMLATAERLWLANRHDARVRNGRDRLAYQAGVVRGFRDKLSAERKELRGTGLVWVGDGDLDRFYRTRHPRIVTRRSYVRMGGAHAAGREAGRTVVLHKPVTSTSASGGGGPRLLR